ncbi:MAG: ABC transporter substrate-binding protein [Bacteroidales bacterium]|nr:ABC transporter substrate-binding protein [Bacteroidales bacterium]MCF8387966.1 ABC transporter substrate-binding protein [Bacteroidales bacterium]
MKSNLVKLLAIAFLFIMFSCNQTGTVNTESDLAVYERVINSNTLRASYLSYPPACMKDTKTGEMSGIFVDVLQKACDNLGLKLEWTEEVGWSSQIEGLETNRYDIVGSPVWANPTRGKLTSMTIPVYYSGIGVYVRSDDNRFDGNLHLINDPNVRIGTIDGETADLIARTDFPDAKRVSSIQNTGIAQKFLDLTSNKCDVVFAEPYYAYEYLKNNPGTLKNIAEANPIRLFGNCYMFKKNEFQMQQMLNVAIQDLINSGYVDKIISKYEPAPHLFYRSANQYKPFE